MRSMAHRSIFIRALWFIFIEWWATPIVVNIAWILNATVVFLSESN